MVIESFGNYKSSFIRKGFPQRIHNIKTITNNVKLAEAFNTFFRKIAPNLNIENNLGDNITNPNIADPVFHSRQLNNQLSKIQERALPLVYKDNKLTLDDLLKLDNSVTIHQRKPQILATEIFKVKNSLAPEIITEIFEIIEPNQNLRSEASHFKTENAKSTHCGIQSVRHLGP